jgi:hypothetical protein
MVLEGGTKVFPIYQGILDRLTKVEERVSGIEAWITEHLAEIEEDRSFRKNNIRSKEDMMKMLAELQRAWNDPGSSDLSVMQLTEMINQKLITASKETIAQEKEKLEEEAKKRKAPKTKKVQTEKEDGCE